MKVKKCRICKSFKLKKIFSLGNQPLPNNFLQKPNKNLKLYPLDLLQCTHCGLVQTSHVVPKEEMFENYTYIPSVSRTYLEHFDRLSSQLIDELGLKSGDLVVDIGGSDATFSTFFKKKGMKVLQIEPAKNIASKVDKITGYFSQKTAKAAVKLKGRAKLVTATNVFAHINDLDEFLKALDLLLADDGIFFAQFPDVTNIFAQNQFDTIYHEHLSYFSTEALYHLFNTGNFQLLKIESSSIHGGSMRIFVKRRPNLVKEFRENVKQIKKDLNDYLRREKKLGRKIVGFGAAAKGTILLNFCNLDNTVVDYIVDGTPYKQGKFTPATNIPIYPEKHLLIHPPEIVLILAWNFKDEIMYKLEDRGYTFVIPVPSVQIITP